jgi:hypothetical protein
MLLERKKAPNNVLHRSELDLLDLHIFFVPFRKTKTTRLEKSIDLD